MILKSAVQEFRFLLLNTVSAFGNNYVLKYLKMSLTKVHESLGMARHWQPLFYCINFSVSLYFSVYFFFEKNEKKDLFQMLWQLKSCP